MSYIRVYLGSEHMNRWNLLNLQVPEWANYVVSDMRRRAQIPDCISDLLVFIAIEENSLRSVDRALQVNTLRYALGYNLAKLDWNGDIAEEAEVEDA